MKEVLIGMCVIVSLIFVFATVGFALFRYLDWLYDHFGGK